MKQCALIAAGLLVLVGCVGSQGFRSRPEFPVLRVDTLSPVEALGYQIYLQDEAAWQATDLALANGLKETPAQGWIVLLSDGGWTVRFIGPCGAEACAYVDVDKRIVATEPTLSARDAAALSPMEASMWRARQTALSQSTRRCTEQINTAIVADVLEGEPVWRVYLLASSSRASDVVLAGHVRMTISGDGRSLISNEPLSKSCLIDKFDANASALFVTHLLHPLPIETHVFTSLTYRVPLGVGTSAGTFMVEGASIRRLAPR